MQKAMSPQQLAEIGAALNEALKPATKTCSLPRRSRPAGG